MKEYDIIKNQVHDVACDIHGRMANEQVEKTNFEGTLQNESINTV